MRRLYFLRICTTLLLLAGSSPSAGHNSTRHDEAVPTTARPDSTAPANAPCDALTEILAAFRQSTGKEYPETPQEWESAMSRFGSVEGIPMPFSRAPSPTDSQHPRLLYRIAGAPTQPGVPDLSSRFFLGITYDGAFNKTAEVQSFTLPQRTGEQPKFRFGLIQRGVDGNPHGTFEGDEIRQCFTCHKSRGPIFGENPWSNTPFNPEVQLTFIQRLLEGPAGSRDYPMEREVFREVVGKNPGATASDILGRLGNDPRINKSVLRVNGEPTQMRLVNSGVATQVIQYDQAVSTANQDELEDALALANLYPERRRSLVRRGILSQLTDVVGLQNSFESLETLSERDNAMIHEALSGVPGLDQPFFLGDMPVPGVTDDIRNNPALIRTRIAENDQRRFRADYKVPLPQNPANIGAFSERSPRLRVGAVVSVPQTLTAADLRLLEDLFWQQALPRAVPQFRERWEANLRQSQQLLAQRQSEMDSIKQSNQPWRFLYEAERRFVVAREQVKRYERYLQEISKPSLKPSGSFVPDEAVSIVREQYFRDLLEREPLKTMLTSDQVLDNRYLLKGILESMGLPQEAAKIPNPPAACLPKPSVAAAPPPPSETHRPGDLRCMACHSQNSELAKKRPRLGFPFDPQDFEAWKTAARDAKTKAEKEKLLDWALSIGSALESAVMPPDANSLDNVGKQKLREMTDFFNSDAYIDSLN